MAGTMGESYITKHLSVVLDLTDAQYVANCSLMDQLLWQFSSEAVHTGCFESIAFNDGRDCALSVIIVSHLFEI